MFSTGQISRVNKYNTIISFANESFTKGSNVLDSQPSVGTPLQVRASQNVLKLWRIMIIGYTVSTSAVIDLFLETLTVLVRRMWVFVLKNISRHWRRIYVGYNSIHNLQSTKLKLKIKICVTLWQSCLSCHEGVWGKKRCGSTHS